VHERKAETSVYDISISTTCYHSLFFRRVYSRCTLFYSNRYYNSLGYLLAFESIVVHAVVDQHLMKAAGKKKKAGMEVQK